jgi:hypothetical protein
MGGSDATPATYRKRWTDRVMQDYMNQLNYLMQPVSTCKSRRADAKTLTIRFGHQGVGSELKAAPRLDRFFYDLPTTAGRRNIHVRANEDIGSQSIVDVRAVFPSDSLLHDQFVYAGKFRDARARPHFFLD